MSVDADCLDYEPRKKPKRRIVLIVFCDRIDGYRDSVRLTVEGVVFDPLGKLARKAECGAGAFEEYEVAPRPRDLLGAF